MRKLVLTAVAAMALSGCESVYYDAWESLGVEKRDILVDRVEDAMQAQEEAKEEFADALEAFGSVVNVENTALKSVYDSLSDEFEDAESQAEEVRERIDAVESVSEALFEEWQEELDQYSSASLRSKSAAQLRDTQGRYSQLIGAMRRAESRMEPVLDAFRDQVLYLKHNLNAQAISGLRGELGQIESDVARLIAEMEDSIASSRAFIEDFEAPAS